MRVTECAESSAPEPDPAYRDFSQPIQERVNDLVARMTLKEKVSQMVYDTPAIERLDVPKYNCWRLALCAGGIRSVTPWIRRARRSKTL